MPPNMFSARFPAMNVNTPMRSATSIRDLPRSVRVWERRLGELNVMVEAVEPPPAVWEKISAEIGDVAPPDTTSSTLAAIGAPGEGRPFITEELPLPVIDKTAGRVFFGYAQCERSCRVRWPDSITASLARTA